MFSYSGRVKSPEWRRQLRRADLRHFEIFRHGPILIYIILDYQLGEPTIRSACSPRTVSAWSACLMPFLPLFTGIRHHAHVLTVPTTKARLLCATPAGLDLYIYIYTGHACRHLPRAVPWISEDRLFTSVRATSTCSLQNSPWPVEHLIVTTSLYSMRSRLWRPWCCARMYCFNPATASSFVFRVQSQEKVKLSKCPYSFKKRLSWSKFTALIKFELRYNTRDVTNPKTN